MTERQKYARKKAHVKLTDRNVRQIKVMLDADIPKSRIAIAFAISRRHLYRIIEQYNLETL